MSSILRVCLSSELPAEDERLSYYFYFLYDRLILYKGSEKVNSNYSISTEMPENPVPNMYYILHDGTIHQYLDYTDTVVAIIEDASQIDYILKAGTTYFINSDSRYIDKHDRTLVMPFNSETYELVVNYRDEDKFDNDTIVKYNENTGQFELYSGEDKYEEYSRDLKGFDTSSVKTSVNGSRLSAEVKISSAFGNALKALSDGLFIRSDNKVDKDTFDQYYKDFKDLKAYCYAILDNLDAKITYLAGIITRSAINEEIHNQLVGQYPGIDTALANFDEIRSRLDTIESTAMSYATNTMSTAITDIDGKLEKTSQWKNLSEDVEEYTHEVDYYDKSSEYDKEVGNSKMAAIVTGIEMYDTSKDWLAAMVTGIDMYNNIGDDVAAMTVAIDMYDDPDINNKDLGIISAGLYMYENIHDDIAAMTVAVDMYEDDMTIKDKDVAAISIGLVQYESDIQNDRNFAAVSLGVSLYDEPDVSDSDTAAISLGLDLYNNE